MNKNNISDLKTSIAISLAITIFSLMISSFEITSNSKVSEILISITFFLANWGVISLSFMLINFTKRRNLFFAINSIMWIGLSITDEFYTILDKLIFH